MNTRDHLKAARYAIKEATHAHNDTLRVVNHLLSVYDVIDREELCELLTEIQANLGGRID